MRPVRGWRLRRPGWSAWRLVRFPVIAAAVVAVLVPSLSGAGPRAAFASAAARQTARPAWWGYTRPATYKQVVTELMLPIDGVKLQCDLSRPGTSAQTPAPGRFPSLLVQYTPYEAQLEQVVAGDDALFSERGYAALTCVVRGSGESTGTYTPMLSHQEISDGVRLIEWLAHQPWSDGRVGMEGDSYGGMTTMLVAARRPAHLVAIAPQQFPDNLYLDTVYPGGIKSTPYVADDWPTTITAISGGRILGPTVEKAYLAHPTIDTFWRSADVDTHYRDIKVPVLDINSGRPDVYFRASLPANYAGLRKHGWFIVGPWEHGFWQGNDYQHLPTGVLLAWFDHWLAKRHGAPRFSQLSRLVSYEEPVGVGRGWESLNGWPPKDVRTRRLYLGPGTLRRRAGNRGSESYVGAPGSPPANPQCVNPGVPPEPPFETCNRPAGTAGGYLVFNSSRLRHDTVLTGQITLHIRAKADAPQANLYAEAFDIAPNGNATFIDDGALAGSHRLSNSHPTPLKPGRMTTFRFSISAFDWRFAAGHHLRLRLSAGPADQLVPAEDTPVTVSVSFGRHGSYINLPIRNPGGSNPP